MSLFFDADWFDVRLAERGFDRGALAEFTLTTMEGAVMLTRTHRDVAYFDRAIGQLREYFGRLVKPVRRTARTRAAVAPRPSRARPRSRRRSPR